MIPPGLLPEGLRDRLPPQAEATAALVRSLTASFAAHAEAAPHEKRATTRGALTLPPETARG